MHIVVVRHDNALTHTVIINLATKLLMLTVDALIHAPLKQNAFYR